MHLTCTNQAPALCGEALADAKSKGIRNIVALRGDPPKGQEKWEAVEGGFNCALDLVKCARREPRSFRGTWRLRLPCALRSHQTSPRQNPRANPRR